MFLLTHDFIWYSPELISCEWIDWTDTSLRYRHWRMCFERLLQAFARWQPDILFDIAAQPILEYRWIDSYSQLRPMGLQWIMSVFWHFWVKYTKKFVISCRIVWSINVVNIGLTCFNMNKKSVYLIHYSMERAFACYNESTLDRKVLVKTSVL